MTLSEDPTDAEYYSRTSRPHALTLLRSPRSLHLTKKEHAITSWPYTLRRPRTPTDPSLNRVSLLATSVRFELTRVKPNELHARIYCGHHLRAHPSSLSSELLLGVGRQNSLHQGRIRQQGPTRLGPGGASPRRRAPLLIQRKWSVRR